MPANTDFLSTVPLFQRLDARAIEQLDRVARPVVFADGFEVLKEGGASLGFFLVTEGKLEVTVGQTVVATLARGDHFGEMSLLDDEPCAATVRSIGESRCLAIYRWDFLADVRTNMELALELLATLSRRVRQLNAKVALP
jgi:CRP/FNR family transcriptional regulator/CRP/FNR family cyclic AMP-dependent transcriptional regulator